MRREYARWTVAEETKLRELHPTTSLATIAKELGRPPHAVYDKAIRMGRIITFTGKSWRIALTGN